MEGGALFGGPSNKNGSGIAAPGLKTIANASSSTRKQKLSVSLKEMRSTSLSCKHSRKKSRQELSLFDSPFPPHSTANRSLSIEKLCGSIPGFMSTPLSLIYWVICISSEDTALAAVVAK